MNIEKIKKYIIGAEVISFDMYDTLIHRTVKQPERVFDLIEKMCIELWNIETSFAKKRKVAEQVARRKAAKEGKEDVTLKDIYEELPYDIAMKKRIMAMENQIEIDVCCKDFECISLLHFCAAYSKKIIITTDIYLPRDTIYKILKNAGVLDLCSKVYISSEIGMTKGSGNLYRYITADLNVTGKQIVHLGDNYESDYTMALQNGLQAVWIRDQCTKSIYFSDSKKIEEEHLRYFILRNGEKDENATEYNLGFGLIGPLCYSFCRWLHNECLKHQFDCLAFVAREGWLLKHIYLSLYPEDKDKCRYFKLNKNTLRLPLLYVDGSINSFKKLIPDRNSYTMKQIFHYILVDPDSSQIRELLKKYGYIIESNILRTELESKNFCEFYTDLYNIQKPIIEEQYMLLKEYMSEYVGKIALINNSIEANVQSYLESLEKKDLCSKRSFWGIHFIITPKGMKKIQNRCSVYFDESLSQFSKRVFYRNCVVIEHLLFENNGTALFLRKNQEKGVEVICDTFIEEKPNVILLDKIRKGAFDFITDYSKHIPLVPLPGYILHALEKFILKPRYFDAVRIAAIVDREYTGTYSLATKISNKNIMCIYKTFINNDITKWKSGFLKINFNNGLIIQLYIIYLRIEMIKRKLV